MVGHPTKSVETIGEGAPTGADSSPWHRNGVILLGLTDNPV